MITGVIAGACFLALLYVGSYWYGALMVLLAIIGFHEYIRLNRIKAANAGAWLGFLGVVYLVFPFELFGWYNVYAFERSAWVLLFLLMSITVISKNRDTIDRASLLFLGIIYIGLGFHYMSVTRLADPEHGFFWAILVFACIWASDSGAYFTGRWFGKHLLWPTISPKKTVEGAVGGTLLAVVVALLFAVSQPELLSIDRAIILGLVVALVGQMGDLIQSAYKRVRDVKDSGSLLPGHGGVLDRCDSWLIVFPFVHLLGLIPV
jgi:phosphatidate cytidylyltransferase